MLGALPLFLIHMHGVVLILAPGTTLPLPSLSALDEKLSRNNIHVPRISCKSKF